MLTSHKLLCLKRLHYIASFDFNKVLLFEIDPIFHLLLFFFFFLLYTQKVIQRFSLNYVGYTAKVE